MRNLIIIFATVMALVAGGAQAKSCKDAKGHFARCPSASSVLPLASPPMATKVDATAMPKKLSKAEAKKELAAAQTPPAATTQTPTRNRAGLMGLFKPKGAPAGAPPIPMAATSIAPLANRSLPAGHPVCKKGKPCGNSCIAQNKVCHKG